MKSASRNVSRNVSLNVSRTLLLLIAVSAWVACGDDTAPHPDAGGPKDLVAHADSAPKDGKLPGDLTTIEDASISSDATPTRDGPTSDTGSGSGGAAAACIQKSQAIRAATGTTIEVAPGSKGKVIVKGKSKTLRQVVADAQAGETILLADGTYTFQESTGGNSYTGLYFTHANVTMRSKSGNRDAVILDSNYADHGGETAPITIAAPGIVLADFTVKRSIFHLIHLWAKGDKATIHNLRLIDGGQQFIKASPGSGKYVDHVEVTCSSFLMTKAGRDNIWGYGAQDGTTRCYTGGIDTHNARDWTIADNRFEGIYCEASGTKHPAHGKKAALRGGKTYLGGLAEYAIHMWDSPKGSAHTIERNQIFNCARGIGVGMATDVYGAIIRNNMIFSKHAGSSEHDVGINIERGHAISLFNNTVFFSSPHAYANAIEYRWGVSSGLQLRNNLTNHKIQARNGAQATQSANITSAQAAWFVDAAAGDLHLASCTNAALHAQGTPLAAVKDDIDGDPRTGGNDIGADQCTK